MIQFISMFSGIEAASVAFEPIGWEAVCFAEVEPFPSAVLAYRFPHVPNVGDMSKHDWSQYRGRVPVVVGGPPCQAFSVAGLRQSLDDDRGNLTLEFVKAIHAIEPLCALIENVPGLLNTEDNAFGCFLAGLVGADAPLQGLERGGKWPSAGMVAGPRARVAWRVLDTQHFGLPQRRERVFVVVSFDDGIDPAAVLFERQSLRWDTPPRREAGEGASLSPALRARANSSHRADTQAYIADEGGAIPALSMCLTRGSMQRLDAESETLIPTIGCGFDVAHSLRGEGFDASEDGTGRGTPIIPVHAFDARQSDVIQYGDRTGPLDTDGHTMAICFSAKDHGADAADGLAPTLRAGGHAGSHANAGVMPAVAFALRGREGGAMPEVSGDQVGALRASEGGSTRDYVAASSVRRLTPDECARLQGFPDGWARIRWRGKPADQCPDGPQYKCYGNSWSVPVVRWIGERLDAQLRQIKARSAA